MAWSSLFWWGLSSAAMAYVYYGVMRLPRGLTRLMASLPLIAFYIYMAKEFDTVFLRGNYSFFFIWLTSFKIVLLCWDDGPAADPWAVASFPRFLAVMTLSLQIKREKFGERKKVYSSNLVNPLKEDFGDSNDSVVVAQGRKPSATKRTGIHSRPLEAKLTETTSPRKPDNWRAFLNYVDESQDFHMVFLRLLFKFVILALICGLYAYQSSMPSGLIYFLYSCHLYVACSVLFEGIAAVVSPILGIELEPAYNKPFLAHSLSDFWGRRWNLLVSNLLRVSIYDPMLRLCLRNGERHRSKTELANGATNEEALLVKQQSKENAISAYTSYAINPPLWARSISVLSCFLVSGLMHELIFYYMNLGKPTWYATFFFTLNGVATLLEIAVRRKTGLRLPKYVSTPLTLSFVFLSAIWFFYPAILAYGTGDKAIAEFQYFFLTLYAAVVGGGSYK